MLWGSYIVGVSIILLMPSNLMLGAYTVLAVISFSLFGLGLAFYATPSTDAALSNLPEDQAGAGAGIYKMVSSLGASFGVAISTIYTAIAGNNGGVRWIEGETAPPIAECTECSEPLRADRDLCPWCSIDDVNRITAAANNPFSVLEHHGLLEESIGRHPARPKKPYQ